MWIRTQVNRLVNLEKIEAIEMNSRRETTAGNVVYEVLARRDLGSAGTHILARFTEEAGGLRLLAIITQAIQSGQPLLDIPALEQTAAP